MAVTEDGTLRGTREGTVEGKAIISSGDLGGTEGSWVWGTLRKQTLGA